MPTVRRRFAEATTPTTLSHLSEAEQAKFRLAIRNKGFEDPQQLVSTTFSAKTQDPAGWVQSRLNENLWSKQVQIMESVRDNRLTAVHSAHGIGKSYLASRLAAWWIDTHPPGEAFVVTTGPSWDQVRTVLWREIGRAHAIGKLPGRLNQTEWFMTMPAGNEETVAQGIRPPDYNPTAFQGKHATFMLVIMDEAGGVPSSIWEAAGSLTSTKESRFIAIGNPDDPTTEFAEVCKPGSSWNVIGISAFDTPNFTGEVVPAAVKRNLVSPEWVEEKRKRWGETNPMYIARVLGRFPDVSKDALIPMSWVRDAQERTLTPGQPVQLGVDVGGGTNHSSIMVRRGDVARMDDKYGRTRDPDTMNLLTAVQDTMQRTGADIAKVDSIGIGWGILDRAKQIADNPVEHGQAWSDLAKRMTGVRVDDPASDPSFFNLRAEGYWSLRERFREGKIDIDPYDDDLAAQLVDIRYKRTSSGGKIIIESKKDMKARGQSSPDDADALMLAYLEPVVKAVKKKRAGTWGRR